MGINANVSGKPLKPVIVLGLITLLNVAIIQDLRKIVIDEDGRKIRGR